MCAYSIPCKRDKLNPWGERDKTIKVLYIDNNDSRREGKPRE